MKYITITASSFEEAVGKAREEYGDDVRVLSRRDYTVGGGLFSRKRTRCDLTIYLSSAPQKDHGRTDEASIKEFEKEAQTPDPGTLSSSERLDTEAFRGAFDEKADMSEVAGILDESNVSGSLKDAVLAKLEGEADPCSGIASCIMELCQISRSIQIRPQKYLVILGPTGCGKTTTSAKLAVLYGSQGLSTALVSLDSFKVGAFGQLKGFCDAFDIPSHPVEDEAGMLLALEAEKASDLVMIDTMGISPRDVFLNLKLKGMLSLLDGSCSQYVLALPASMGRKEMDGVFSRYGDYPVSAVIATKIDECGGIGAVLSFCHDKGLPIAFMTNGQHVPGDICAASTASLLEHLHLPGVDMSQASSQIVR